MSEPAANDQEHRESVTGLYGATLESESASAASPSLVVRHALDRADLALQEVSRWTTHMPGVPLNEKVAALVNEAWEAVYAAHNEIRKAEA